MIVGRSKRCQPRGPLRRETHRGAISHCGILALSHCGIPHFRTTLLRRPFPQRPITSVVAAPAHLRRLIRSPPPSTALDTSRPPGHCGEQPVEGFERWFPLARGITTVVSPTDDLTICPHRFHQQSPFFRGWKWHFAPFFW